MPAANRVLRKVFNPQSSEEGKYLIRSSIICDVIITSSESIAIGYGLDNHGIMTRIPARKRYFFFSPQRQTDSWAHPASYSVVPRDISPEVKRPGCEVLFVRVFKKKSDIYFIMWPITSSLLTMRGELKRKKRVTQPGEDWNWVRPEDKSRSLSMLQKYS
jgi:hypothetical protein